jgi:hypothetical protein
MEVKMNNQEVSKLLVMAKSAFPGRSPDNQQELEALATVWRMVLNDIPYKLAEAALIKVLSKNKFFPAPAEIKEAAYSLIPGPPSAEEAWAEVREVITSSHLLTAYQYNGWIPQWSHELVKKTVREMGFRELCASENIGITMAQFKKHYDNNKMAHKEKHLNEQILSLTGAKKLLDDKEINHER